MEIKDFVKEAITEIVSGVNEANQEIQASGAFIASYGIRHYGDGPCDMAEDQNGMPRQISNVDFDIAVTTSDKEEKGGKAGINVLSFGKIGGGLSNQSVSGVSNRLRFSIPLVLPSNVKQD